MPNLLTPNSKWLRFKNPYDKLIETPRMEMEQMKVPTFTVDTFTSRVLQVKNPVDKIVERYR